MRAHHRVTVTVLFAAVLGCGGGGNSGGHSVRVATTPLVWQSSSARTLALALTRFKPGQLGAA